MTIKNEINQMNEILNQKKTDNYNVLPTLCLDNKIIAVKITNLNTKEIFYGDINKNCYMKNEKAPTQKTAQAMKNIKKYFSNHKQRN